MPRRLWWPALTAAPALLVLAIPPRAHAQAPLCSTTGSPAFSVDLAGRTWKFRTGDDLAWPAPDFDDSSWQDRVVPDDWNTTAESRYDGFAWYRIAFTLPEAARRDDGRRRDRLDGLHRRRRHDVPQRHAHRPNPGASRRASTRPGTSHASTSRRTGLFKWGARNVIAVGMYDGTGGGGFYKGPIGLFSKATLRELNGLHTTPASQQDIAQVCDTLRSQHTALAQGGWPYDARDATRRDADGQRPEHERTGPPGQRRVLPAAAADDRHVRAAGGGQDVHRAGVQRPGGGDVLAGDRGERRAAHRHYAKTLTFTLATRNP